MTEENKKDVVRNPRRDIKFTLGDRVDFDALIKKKGIILKEEKLDKKY